MQECLQSTLVKNAHNEQHGGSGVRTGKRQLAESLVLCSCKTHAVTVKQSHKPAYLPNGDRKGCHPAHRRPEDLALCHGAARSHGHRAQQKGQPGAERGLPGQLAHLSRAHMI